MSETTTPQVTVPSKRVVRFRIQEFDAFAEALGFTSNVKKARFVGCGIATMSRIRTGKQNPGPKFIADVCTAAARLGHRGADFFDLSGIGD